MLSLALVAAAACAGLAGAQTEGDDVTTLAPTIAPDDGDRGGGDDDTLTIIAALVALCVFLGLTAASYRSHSKLVEDAIKAAEDLENPAPAESTFPSVQ